MSTMYRPLKQLMVALRLQDGRGRQAAVSAGAWHGEAASVRRAGAAPHLAPLSPPPRNSQPHPLPPLPHLLDSCNSKAASRPRSAASRSPTHCLQEQPWVGAEARHLRRGCSSAAAADACTHRPAQVRLTARTGPAFPAPQASRAVLHAPHISVANWSRDKLIPFLPGIIWPS